MFGKNRKVFMEETDRRKLRENVRPELMPSAVSSIRCERKNHSAMVRNRLSGKLAKLSEGQDILLRNGSHSKVAIMDGGQLPKYVLDVLLLRTKQPAIDKFKGALFCRR